MPHSPTLKQLRYLCALAEHLHFGRAARECNVSQSTLSGAILELEENLGISLVERSNRQVLLTRVGEDLVHRGQRILREVDDLVAASRSHHRPFHGELHLGVIPTVSPFVLPELLSRMRVRHPHCRPFVREDTTETLTTGLESGTLDVLLIALPYNRERVETHHLFHDDFLLACPPDHPLARAERVRSRDLTGQDLLLLEEGHCLRDQALEACQLGRQEVRIRYQSTSLTTLVQMVASGVGITLVPRMAVQADILRGTNIVTREFEEETVRRSIGLMWRAHSPRREEFLELGELLREQRAATVDSGSTLAV